MSHKAVQFLKKEVDVGVVINDHNECSYFKGEDGKPHFERRRASDPDLTFFLSPEAIQSLVDAPHSTLADVVKSVAQNYLLGSIQVRFSGPLPNLVLRGYMGILRASGIENLKILQNLGRPALTKILKFIRK